MDKLMEISKRAVEDYGFRQIALWSPDDLVDQWQLSPREGEVLKGPLKEQMEQLPIPVEPKDYSSVEDRLNALVREALA